MTKQKVIIVFVFTFFLLVSSGETKDKVEVTAEDAVRIASNIAEKKKYNAQSADVEVLKVKKRIERGPVRLAWLIRYFPREERKLVFENEFWIVYFYPKGTLAEPRILGGEFCALVELYSGKVLAAFKVP